MRGEGLSDDGEGGAGGGGGQASSFEQASPGRLDAEAMSFGVWISTQSRSTQ